MASLSVSFTAADFPEGAKMTPGEYAAWIAENLAGTVEGDTLAGQIGGARPGTDVGLYVTGKTIEVWDSVNSKYVTTGYPVGGLLFWPSVALAYPENFILCDGSLLLRTEYPDLFSVIGVQWGSTGSTNFRLPDMRGRFPMGAGLGKYYTAGNPTSSLREYTNGSYYGTSWIQNRSTPPDSPSGRVYGQPETHGSGSVRLGDRTWLLEAIPPAVVMAVLIKYR